MEIDTQETLGQRIRRLRLEKGMTQTEVADGFVTVSMISQIERDANTPSVELLQHIAKKLQVPLHELAKNKDEQMETAWRHKLAKVYILTKHGVEAETLIVSLREQRDLSQAVQIELTVDLAESFYIQMRYEEALELLLPLVEELTAVNYDDAHMMALIHFTSGNVYYNMQNYSGAIFHYRSAYSLTVRFGEFDYLAARIAFKTGSTLQLIGNEKEAIYFLDRAFDFYQYNDNLYRLAATMVSQGISYKNRHNFKQASQLLIDAMGIYHVMNLQLEAHNVKLTLASTVTVNEDPERAFRQLEDCEIHFQEKGNAPDLIFLYSKMAAVLLLVHKNEESFEYLKKAIKLIDDHSCQNEQESGECYKILSRYYFHQGAYPECIEYALKASDVFERAGMLADQVDALQVACDAYHTTGNDTQAFNLERNRNLLLLKLYERGLQ